VVFVDDIGRPYFMYNKDWYYYDEKEEIYKLTDKAPKEAIDSYNDFYNTDDTIFD
jgi:hypothetical protein